MLMVDRLMWCMTKWSISLSTNDSNRFSMVSPLDTNSVVLSTKQADTKMYNNVYTNSDVESNMSAVVDTARASQSTVDVWKLILHNPPGVGARSECSIHTSVENTDTKKYYHL